MKWNHVKGLKAADGWPWRTDHQKKSRAVSPLQGRTRLLPIALTAGMPEPGVWIIIVSTVIFHGHHWSPICLPTWSGHDLLFSIFPYIISTRWSPTLLCRPRHSPILPNIPVLSGKPVSLEAETPFISIWIFLNQTTFLSLNILHYGKGSFVGRYRASSGFLFFLIPVFNTLKILLPNYFHGIKHLPNGVSPPAHSFLLPFISSGL